MGFLDNIRQSLERAKAEAEAKDAARQAAKQAEQDAWERGMTDEQRSLSRQFDAVFPPGSSSGLLYRVSLEAERKAGNHTRYGEIMADALKRRQAKQQEGQLKEKEKMTQQKTVSLSVSPWGVTGFVKLGLEENGVGFYGTSGLKIANKFASIPYCSILKLKAPGIPNNALEIHFQDDTGMETSVELVCKPVVSTGFLDPGNILSPRDAVHSAILTARREYLRTHPPQPVHPASASHQAQVIAAIPAPIVAAAQAASCLSCQAPLTTGAAFCVKCGSCTSASCASCNTPLRSDAHFCSHCGTPTKKKCAKCGEVLPPGAAFCVTCGAKA